MAYADNGNTFFGECGIRVAQAAALLRAARGVRFWIKINEGIAIFIDAREIEFGAGFSDAGNGGSGIARPSGSRRWIIW